jgi:hypothetical protein
MDGLDLDSGLYWFSRKMQRAHTHVVRKDLKGSWMDTALSDDYSRWLMDIYKIIHRERYLILLHTNIVLVVAETTTPTSQILPIPIE